MELVFDVSKYKTRDLMKQLHWLALTVRFKLKMNQAFVIVDGDQ